MILVYSPKGGCGATTVAANLALALARQGRDVTLLDLAGQGTLGICLGGNPGAIESTRSHAERQPVILAGVQLVTLARNGLVVEAVREIVRHSGPDQVIVADLAPDDTALLEALLPLSALPVCVLAPEPAVLTLLPRTIDRMPAAALNSCCFVLNRIDYRMSLSRDIAGVLDGLLGRKLIATIRRDEAINEAAAMMEPLNRYAPESAALADIEKLAARIAESLGSDTEQGAA